MMIKKHGLGSGLSELLSDIKIKAPEASADKGLLRHLPIDKLQPGKYQPRQDMNQDKLAELADSIRTQGIIQPIVIRPIAPDAYEIIAGERRWRAAQLANLHEVPVVVRNITDEQAVALSLIENIQREDLNAIDTAASLHRLIQEFGMTHESAAEAVGKSRATVTNLLRLLELPESIKHMVQRGEIEMGHARALLCLDTQKQLAAAAMIVAKKLSVRATENLVRQLQKTAPEAKVTKQHDPNIVQLQQRISDKFSAPVNIQYSKSGKGKIIINYSSLDELEGILEKFQLDAVTNE